METRPDEISKGIQPSEVESIEQRPEIPNIIEENIATREELEKQLAQVLPASEEVKEAPKAEEPASEESASEELASEATKAEESASEATKAEELASEATKAEELTSEATKAEEPASEAIKAEEPASEESASEAPLPAENPSQISEESPSSNEPEYSLSVKVLNLRKIYTSFIENEELVVYYYNTEQKRLERKDIIIRTVTPETIEYDIKDTDTEEQWTYANFMVNSYGIVDIIRSNDIHTSEETFTTSIVDFQPQIINMETRYIQKAEYERIYPLEDQVESLYEYYVRTVDNASKHANAVFRHKAQSFGELIDSITPRVDVRMNPLTDNITRGFYTSSLVTPIVHDTFLRFKKDSSKVVDLLESEEEDPQVTLLSDDKDAEYLSNRVAIEEFYAKSRQQTLADTAKLNIHQAIQLDIRGGKLPNGVIVDENVSHPYAPLPIYDVTQNLTVFKTRAKGRNSYDVYRNIPTSNSMRRTRGDYVLLQDRPDILPIRGSTCRGTAKTAETLYFNKNDIYVPVGKEFNKAITREPAEEVVVSGEELHIVGFVLSPPKYNTPWNDYVQRRKVDDDTYILQSNGGWWSLMDRIIHQRRTQQIHVEPSANNTVIRKVGDELDYNKYNYVYLTSNDDGGATIDEEEYMRQIESFVPSVSKVMDIERRSIVEADNIGDVCRILSKYFLTLRDVNVSHLKQLETIFHKRYNLHKRTVEIEQRIAKYYNQLNSRIQQIFQHIYDTLWKVDATGEKVTIEEVGRIAQSYFIGYGNSENKDNVVQLLRHILDVYFHESVIDYASLDDLWKAFIRKFFERYADYVSNASAMRVLLRSRITTKAESSKPDEGDTSLLFQRFTEHVKKYYDFTNLTNLPMNTNIGAINQMYHTAFIKDNRSRFNLFADMVYALHGYDEATAEIGRLKNSNTGKIDNMTLGEVEIAIRKEQVSGAVCDGYRISKLYLSLRDLFKDNRREVSVDRMFDKMSAANALMTKWTASAKSPLSRDDVVKRMKGAFPYEHDSWIDKAVDELMAKTSKWTSSVVTEGNYALVVDGQEGVYRIYVRTADNMWEAKTDVPDFAKIQPYLVYKKDGTVQVKMDKSLELPVLCGLEGANVETMAVVEKLLEIVSDSSKKESKATAIKSILNKRCVMNKDGKFGVCTKPSLIRLYQIRDELESREKSIRYYSEQMEIYRAIYGEALHKMDAFLKEDLYVTTNDTKVAVKTALEDEKDYDYKQIRPYIYQFATVKQTPNIDLRYSEIDKFITTYGLLNRVETEDGTSLRKVSVEDTP